MNPEVPKGMNRGTEKKPADESILGCGVQAIKTDRKHGWFFRALRQMLSPL